MIETTFTDISDWQKNYHYSTGGTRSKYIAVEPETNTDYFFKGSKETPEGEIRYPTEFWSEIISSKIGKLLDFPLLDYNIGYDKNHKQKIGCLSKTMIAESSSKLTEGITYLTGSNPSYSPDKDKKDYTFQFICSALEEYRLDKYIKNIIEIIVFDSVIGNSDRHQENWGIITTQKTLKIELKKNNLKENMSLFVKVKKKLISSVNDYKESDENKEYRYFLSNTFEFAPIYDSGCCLGREHTDEKVSKLLSDKQMLRAYVNRGTSEIHWENGTKKVNHFELVGLLLKLYPEEVKEFINKVRSAYNEQLIKETIYKVDAEIPKELINFKLSDERKEMMFKLVTLRIEKLLEII